MTGGAGHLTLARPFQRLARILGHIQKDRTSGGIDILPLFAIGADEGDFRHVSCAPLTADVCRCAACVIALAASLNSSMLVYLPKPIRTDPLASLSDSPIACKT